MNRGSIQRSFDVVEMKKRARFDGNPEMSSEVLNHFYKELTHE
jgi:hypothetical protein